MPKRPLMFFATADDIGVVLAKLESIEPLHYTKTGMSEEDRPRTVASYTDIPGLGEASHPTAVMNPTYLLSAPSLNLYVEPVPQHKGGILYAVDQRGNPDTVQFCPAGRYGSDTFLYGTVSTASSSPFSTNLYKRLRKLIRDAFTKEDEFFLGPEARQLWKDGVRFAMAVQTPREYDFLQHR